ncbi:MAG: hypothetical protein M3R43_05010, partial [Acidobacteriota bacterium]|nr:hypothetical protein [Acidobacteriota bacterium]
FDLRRNSPEQAKYTLSTEHNRCTLHLWSEQRNLVRRVISATPRGGSLRLATQRFGQTQTKLLELVASRERRTPTTRETARTRYLKTLERVLQRGFPDFKTDGFRTAMDLERSFGPAYARGSLLRGQQAWAVISVNQEESAATVDGILTLGILWLHHCREQAGGRRLYQGLKLIVPGGTATATLSRLAWLNESAAQWQLYELDQKSEELTPRDAADHGNLRTRLIHHPDEEAACERFATAVEQVLGLVPVHEHARVEQRLRSTAELAFLLHGLEFARARLGFTGNSFAPALEITVGAGGSETALTDDNRAELSEAVAELFRRRRADAVNKTKDPLFRASPERWLESVLRRDMAPLTRHLAAQIPTAGTSGSRMQEAFANDPDPDTIGNRADPPVDLRDGNGVSPADESRVIPRLDPHHVYAQVPAIAGAKDRGMLDLLGVTADGRLAVIELKADDDLHLALQGLDYWIRVRHHHLQNPDAKTGLGEFQRHGYFRGVELSPLPPRLYLVAPALHIHPATEIILRYFSPRVEWNLLALDERWRSKIRVIWRKQGGSC